MGRSLDLDHERWLDSGSPEACVKNIETHIDVLLSDEEKEAINWHPRQSVQLAVMRIIGLLHERDPYSDKP